MSAERSRPGYKYTYHAEVLPRREVQNDLAISEDLKYIASTLASLTGGCEICTNCVAQFCQVHHHPAMPGDPRCDDFIRRFPEDPEKVAKAQVQAFVNQTLGVSKTNLLRLTEGR